MSSKEREGKRSHLRRGGVSLLSKLISVFLKSQERPWCECGNTGTRSQVRLGPVKLQEGPKAGGLGVLFPPPLGEWKLGCQGMAG